MLRIVNLVVSLIITGYFGIFEFGLLHEISELLVLVFTYGLWFHFDDDLATEGFDGRFDLFEGAIH